MKKWVTLLSVVSIAGSLVAGCGSSPSAPASSKSDGKAPSDSKSGNTASDTKGGSASKDVKTMRLGIGLNEESTQYKGCVKFKELAEKYSNNTIKVELYPSNQLGADLNMTQQLQTGALESTIPSTSPVANIVPDFSVFDFPFLFKNDKIADKVLDGPAGQYILDKLPEKGIIGLGYWENGFRDLTNSKHPIQTMKDLSGIKLRVMQNQVHIDFWKALGANPTPMSFDQVFNALQQDVIDAQENPIQTIYTQKFYEVQKYVTLTHHVYTPFAFLVSKMWFEGLSKDQQDAIKKAAVEAGQYQRKLNRDEANSNLEALKQKGMTVSTISDDELQKMRDAVKPVIDKYSAKYPDASKKIFDAVKEAEKQ